MVRMNISYCQRISYIPAIELMIEIYYDESKENEKLAYTSLGMAVEIIEKITKFCNGSFFNCLPLGKPRKANLTALMTIGFESVDKIEEFEEKLKNIQQ